MSRNYKEHPVYFTIEDDHIRVTLADHNDVGFHYSAKLTEDAAKQLAIEALKAAEALPIRKQKVHDDKIKSIIRERDELNKKLKDLGVAD